MSHSQPKYILDTNLFIHAFRDSEANGKLIEFHAAFAPFEYLHSVVVQELRAGVRAKSDLRKLERHIFDPFLRCGRVVSPSTRAWSRSGDVLRDLSRKHGLELSKVTKAFGNDILIAASCGESGVVLVTDNLGDFQRIRTVFDFEFIPPWPVRH